MADKVIFAMYDDDDKLMDGAKHLVANDVKVSDVYSPMPLHGIDPIIGVEPTRLAITAFMYGLTGTMLAIIGIRYMMIVDWPMNIGGKPNFTFYQNAPAFVPIIFECTVLFAGHLMSITYFFRNKLYPGATTKSPDPRTTDDKFLMEFIVDSNEAEIKKILKATGASEINEKEIGDE